MIVDIRRILNAKVLISMKYDINVIGAAFCTVIISAQFSHLNPSVTPGSHQWSGVAPLLAGGEYK
jgi:glycerol uptake facilitator-like aquaporin